MSNRNDNDAAAIVLALSIGLAAVVLGIVWMFSQTLGLDMSSGGWVRGGLVALAIAVWCALKLDLFEPIDIVPAALAGLWVCFWPALTYWGTSSSPFARLGSAFAQSDDDIQIAWWAAWYTKLGVLLAILLIGYGVRWWKRRW